MSRSVRSLGRASWGRSSVLLLLAIAALVGCSDTESPSASSSGPTGGVGTYVKLSFAPGGSFYAIPFPSDARRRADGRFDAAGFPNPYDNDYANKISGAFSKGVDGFSRTAGVFFAIHGAIDPATLPTLETSITKGASVRLIDVSPESADYLKSAPFTADFRVDPGPFGEPNLLSILPLQGVPLRPRTRYAAVITSSVKDTAGKSLGPSVDLATLLRGETPPGVSDAVAKEHLDALSAIEKAGIDRSTIAGLTVFTTWDPVDEMARVRDDVLSKPVPQLASSFVKAETFDRYCVYQATVPMPVYQEGTPPYSSTGGGWTFDAAGKPIKQRDEMAKIVVTVPRGEMPSKGFPVVLFSRTGAGGDRPLVDRGVQPSHNAPALIPGSGPAQNFAAAGFAGVSVDGPHGGLRNVTNADEQFTMFNVANLDALRDNVRQSAIELVLQAHLLETLEVPLTGENACPDTTTFDGGPARFDTSHIALMGHSMGATIAPLSFAVEPKFGALILSGAGGSYIENVVHKRSPVQVLPIADLLVGYDSEHHLHEHDPILTLLQWATEPSDPPVYTPPVLHGKDAKARHVLMLQGIVDTYILPPIANCTSLSFGLDQAGKPFDQITPEIAQFTPLEPLLTYSGRSLIDLPVNGNVNVNGVPATAVVIQHPQDAVEDGHEVVFQTEPPKHEYRCFLSTWLSGLPKVPEGHGEFDPCP